MLVVTISSLGGTLGNLFLTAAICGGVQSFASMLTIFFFEEEEASSNFLSNNLNWCQLFYIDDYNNIKSVS